MSFLASTRWQGSAHDTPAGTALVGGEGGAGLDMAGLDHSSEPFSLWLGWAVVWALSYPLESSGEV